MDWNDLRIFCAVAESRTLGDAATRLRLSIATVARHLDSLEQDLGFKVTRRSPKGVELTIEGERVWERASKVEARMNDVDRLTTALRSDGRTMPVRVSATEPIISELLAPALQSLMVAPHVRIDLVSTTEVVSLSAHEADIAVRFAKPIGDSLIVRSLPSLRFGLYASRAYLAGRDPAGLELKHERLIGFDGSYGRIAEVAWIEENGLAKALAVRTSSARAMARAVEAGVGIALLPRVFASTHDLIEIPSPSPIPKRPVWLVTHRDLQSVPAIKRVRSWIVALFQEISSQNS